MNIAYDTFISVEDLSNNTLIKERLKKHSQLIVIQDNKPVFTIQSIESHVSTKKEELETLLSKVGKKIFIEYFTLFRDYEKSEGVLPIEYSLSSRRLRAASARNIFKQGLEVEALKTIASSQKLDLEIKLKAKELLQAYGITLQDERPLSYVGKNVIPLLLNEEFMKDEINKFTTTEYTKEMFSMYYPLLVEVDEFYNMNDKIQDHNRYTRYYKEPITIQDKDYLLCSQWNKRVQQKKVFRYITSKLLYMFNQSKDKTIDKVFIKYSNYLPEVIYNGIKEEIAKGE